MGASQRAKGAVAEREVAAILQAWWSQHEPGCRFVRTPSSGGWHGRDGGGIRADFKASGDLMTTAKLFPFTVEVKRREGWAEKTFLAGKPSPVWPWWRQAQAQAQEQREKRSLEGPGYLGALPEPKEPVPMLVFRRSNEQWRVLVPADWWDRDDWHVDWRSTVRWRGRWPMTRGSRPVCHYLLQMTGIHPRMFVPGGRPQCPAKP